MPVIEALTQKLLSVGVGLLVDRIKRELLDDFSTAVTEEHLRFLHAVKALQDDTVRTYYKVGKRCLQDASKAVQDTNRDEAIRHALEQFRLLSELGNLPHGAPNIDAEAQYFVGICWQLLGEIKLAHDWYLRSYESCKAKEMSLLGGYRFSLIPIGMDLNDDEYLVSVYETRMSPAKDYIKPAYDIDGWDYHGALVELYGLMKPLTTLLIKLGYATKPLELLVVPPPIDVLKQQKFPPLPPRTSPLSFWEIVSKLGDGLMS